MGKVPVRKRDLYAYHHPLFLGWGCGHGGRDKSAWHGAQWFRGIYLGAFFLLIVIPEQPPGLSQHGSENVCR